ncbi:superinfection immunity protein [Evansella clarkii]|jgi:uncharacterized transporter YbjL|uniref:superinfection immunity protein n=1 Tax=Evansella clarkii TaxID=79879 RepID=UPI0009970099|nr:superinfection immunity protein [Evansella clarkii]
MEGLIGGLFLIILFIIGIGVYFAPSIVAYVRKKDNLAAILVLNIFLGWSLIGWVVALVWALTVKNEQVTQ